MRILLFFTLVLVVASTLHATTDGYVQWATGRWGTTVQAGVSGTGAAQISIPIVVFPGTAGMFIAINQSCV